MVHKTFTGYRICQRDSFTPLQVPVPNNNRKQYKTYELNFIPQILAEKIINIITIKDYYAPGIIGPAV